MDNTIRNNRFPDTVKTAITDGTGQRRIFQWLLTIGIVLRIIYLYEYSHSVLFGMALGPDVAEYHARAKELLSGIFQGGAPDIHAPLYSIFLAMCYGVTDMAVAPVRILQTVLLSGMWVWLYFFLRRRAAKASVLPEIFFAFAMCYTPLFFFQAELISEALLLLLLTGSLMLFYHADAGGGQNKLRYFGAGILCGAAAITHPMSLLFVGAEVLFYCHNRRWRAACCVAGGAALLIAPVSLFRSLEAKRPVLIQSNSAFNIFLGNNPQADGSCYIRPGQAWRTIHHEAAVAAKAQNTTSDRIFRQKIVDYVLSSPGRFTAGLLRKAALVFTPVNLTAGADTPELMDFTLLLKSSSRAAGAILWASVIAGLLILLPYRGQNRTAIHEYRHFLLLFAAFFIAQVLTVTSGRYRLPLLPAAFVLAAWCWTAPVGVRRRLLLLLCGGAGVCVALLLTPARPLNSLETDSLYGEAWYQRGALERAKEHLRRSIPFDPGRDANLLGEIARLQADNELAEKYFRYAADHAPLDANGMMNLGIMSVEKGQLAAAEKYFAEGCRRDPDNADAAFNYGYFRERSGDDAAAERLYLAALAADPAHRKAINSLGVLLFRRGDFAGAARRFAQACRLEPGNENLRRNLEAARRRL